MIERGEGGGAGRGDHGQRLQVLGVSGQSGGSKTTEKSRVGDQMMCVCSKTELR